LGLAARYEKARRGELVVGAPVGFVIKAGDSPAGSDPSGALSRKISGWIVPKTETRRPGDVSAGPACVPADLRMNPKTIAAIPNGIARRPN
jgi:hypothetical protein